MNNLTFVDNIDNELADYFKPYSSEKIFVLVDQNTFKNCYPVIRNSLPDSHIIITIPFGEKSKTLEFVNFIWENLSQAGADRKSLLINLGGGVITDIGGFAAGTYQRGIDFINIPTTLLAQIDASIGGKTGFNLNNLKNQIGIFNLPKAVFISSQFLETLPQREFVSGFAEKIKHALLSGKEYWERLKVIKLETIDPQYLKLLIKESINIKLAIVESDPFEKGNREALNFGHTIGHAIETFFNRRNISILHGEAVAIGIIAELFISNKIASFNYLNLFDVAEFLATYFKSFDFNYNDYDELIDIMKHDKKNKNNSIVFTLLNDFGKFEIGKNCSDEEIVEALNFYFQIKK